MKILLIICGICFLFEFITNVYEAIIFEDYTALNAAMGWFFALAWLLLYIYK